jgi:hypothetical protein
MILITDDIRARLLANGGLEEETDHVPVVKFFNPCGAATWIITEMMPHEPDILFGLCDLGMECPELGYVRVSELESVRGPLGLGIERDLHFRPRFTLSVYAEAARVRGHITEGEQWLVAAARRLKLPDNPELPPDFAAVN